MLQEFYLDMCESHLRNEEYHECIKHNDPSPLLKNRIIAYVKKYENLVTENKCKTLTNCKRNLLPHQCCFTNFTCYYGNNSFYIKHILKGSFDFVDRIDTQCTVNTNLSTCDIKYLYTNIKHDVFYNAIKYWTDKFHDDIPFFSRFTKAFILEGLSIILKFNYFYINKQFFHQIKGTL